MSQKMISQAYASGDEIFEIISAIEPVLEGFSRSHVIIALLALSITVQKPDASSKEIQDGVKGVSEWIVTFLDRERDAIRH